MSFDLAVWFETARVSSDVAAEKYSRLCAGDHSVVVETAAVDSFYRDLTAEFPEVSDAGEASPWMAGLDVAGSHVIMPMGWSRVQHVASRVFELADRHGLVCFDPQASVLHVPAALRGPRPLRLERCVGLSVIDPDDGVLERAVRGLSGENWYLILEEDDDRFVQIGLGTSAGVQWDQFAIEHRDDAPDRHDRCVVRDREVVVAAVRGFASGDVAWKAALNWEKLSL